MSDDTKLTPYQQQSLTVQPSESAPTPSTRLMETQVNHSIERMEAEAQVGIQGMQVMSTIERATMLMATADTEFNNLLLRGLATSEHPTAETQAMQEVIKQRFAAHLGRIGQIADVTNLAVMHTVVNTHNELGQRTIIDEVEDLEAGLGDVLFGRRRLLGGWR